MGFLRFLSSLRTLAKNGDITIADAYKFARQEFGEVSDLLKLQINKIFKEVDAPSIKKPEGEVVPFKTSRDQDDFLQRVGRQIEQDRKDLGPIDTKEEGITFSVPEEGIFNQKTSLEEVTDMLTKNPYRAAGPLDPVEGMTRTAARVVLDRKGIKVPERGDPIDVFEENFGGDALMDLRQAGEELVEKEQMGRITESMGEFLESRGLFDLKVDKTARKGMTDEELLKKLLDEDPEEFAKGGRVGYDDGGITSLPKGLQKDTTTGEGANIFNMYAERPEKSFREDLEFIKKLKGGVGTNTILYMVKEAMDKALERGEITKEKHTEMLMPFFGEASERITEKMYNEDMGNYATGGRVGYAYGSGLKLAKVLAIRGKTLVDEIKKAIDNFIQPSGDRKLDADVILDDMLEELNIDRDAIDQKDILNAYDEIYTTISKGPGSRPIKQGDAITSENFGDSQFAPDTTNLKKAREMTPKMIERFELKQKYPGIDEDLVTKIVEDPNPQRKAEVLATIEQAFELMKQGKSSDEILDIMKQMTDRTKQAGGGLSYLSGF